MRVSSKHLTLASRVFKALLKNSFQEGNVLSTEGTVQIELPEDDANVFGVLMSILHGKSRDVPKTDLDLHFLAQMSVLVDKYELHEPVAVFSDRWAESTAINETARLQPTSRITEILQWMSISWVFGMPNEFNEATRQAMWKGHDTLHSDVLPIPNHILGKLVLSKFPGSLD